MQYYTEIYLVLCTEKVHIAEIVTKCWQNWIRNIYISFKNKTTNVIIYLSPYGSQFATKSIPDDEPLLYFLKYFQLGRISMWDLCIFFFFVSLCAFPHHTDWPVICESPHGLADNSWSPCHGPAAFNMNYKMASQAYQWMTGWMCMAWSQRRVRAQWLPHSVNPGTGNTSVARGRVFHQHNVWHCLRQMLCWDVLLTFTTFQGETQACWYVQLRNISQ